MIDRYLTADEIQYVHDRVVTSYGGVPGLRDPAVVASIPTRIRMSTQGRELFSDLHSKAAILLNGLIRERPFHDGNKRAAIAAAAVFLRLNGDELVASDHEIVELCRAVERGSLPPESLREWFRSHSASAA